MVKLGVLQWRLPLRHGLPADYRDGRFIPTARNAAIVVNWAGVPGRRRYLLERRLRPHWFLLVSCGPAAERCVLPSAFDCGITIASPK